MKKPTHLLILSCILLSLIGSGFACQSNTPSPLNESDVRAYADPATETTLQALSENDLTKYTQYGNAEFKAAVTNKVMDETAPLITSRLGNYVSREFLSAEKYQDYIIVHYKAKYTKGETGIRMVFDKDHLVAGQWFE